MKILSSLSLKAKIIAGASTAVAAAGAAVLIFTLVSSSPDAFRLLKIFEMTGRSTVTRVNSGAMDAYEGMNLESGDVIEVGTESKMTLSLDSDKYLSLDPSTVLELIAEGTESDSKTTVNLRSGGVLNEITEPLSAESSYSVNTPKATMAVRGTSFYVSVRRLDDGSYITDLTVFHGKVEVQLLDEEGNPRGEPVIVEPNESIAILTVPAENNITGAEINGTSAFILRKSDGSDTFVMVGEGEDPIMPLNVLIIPRSVIERILNTHDNTEIVLSEEVLRALLGEDVSSAYEETVSVVSESETTDSETTSVISSETITESETEAESSVTSVTEETEASVAETTAPVTESRSEETVIPSELTSVSAVEATESELEIIEEPFENEVSESTSKETEKLVTTVIPTVTAAVRTTTVAEEREDEEITTVTEETEVEEETTVTEETEVEEETTVTEETEVEEETTVTEETEEEAVYYTVSFASNPGGIIVADEQTVEEDGYADEPSCTEQIEVDGVQYAFWQVESELGPITSDTTISVKYVEASSVFTVIVTDNGSTVISGKYISGDSITLPTASGADGAEFKYWGLMGANSGGTESVMAQYGNGASVSVDSSNAYYYEAGNDTNIRIEAVYAYSVTVTFLDYDGTVLGTATAASGEEVTVLDDPERENYSFIGWYYTGSETYFNGTIPENTTSDFSVTATYTGNLVTISYIYDGNSYTQDYGYAGDSYTIASFDAEAAGIADGTTYTFNYYTDADGASYSVGDSISLESDLTLYANVTIS